MRGDDDLTKNMILAAVLSMLVVFGWLAFFAPAPEPNDTPTAQVDGGSVKRVEEGVVVPSATAERADLLAKSDRIQIQTGRVTGSIRLEGGRIDDLHLSDYQITQDKNSDTVILLNPEGFRRPYYIDHGWLRTAGTDPVPLPKADTPWQIEEGGTLTTETPVTLVWDNGAGLIFRRKIAIDGNYMFTITQSVENTTGQPIALAPFGKISRLQGESSGLWILHQGGVAITDGTLVETDYGDLEDIAPNPETGARSEYVKVEENGWLGFTDKYWMASLAAKPGTGFDGFYRVRQLGAVPEFQAQMRQPVIQIPAGETRESESYAFAGAKEFYTLLGYEESLGILDFAEAIDWGWFYFLTRPLFQLLSFLFSIIGNMGFAIIALTLVVKAVLFPLAYKSYVSMSKMKQLQPEMQKIKERVGDDRQKMQQEMMALYKKEKVNPASGCLPILLQIPIFFSLYKVLYVTIEMRHQPFILWIENLSAPDPTSWMNLFGLLPWAAPDPDSFIAFFSIGVFPILMGVTMWLQQKLNPAPTDPTQAMIFAYMPWIFMFMLGQFESGLVIYWVANNTITFIQQYLIMRSQGVKVDLLGNIKSGFKRKRAAAEADK